MEIAARKVLLEGTFSIKEIDMASAPRRKAAKATGKKVAKKTAAKKKVASKKVVSKKVAKKKVSAKDSEADGGTTTIVIAGAQTIKNIADLNGQLDSALACDAAATVDLSQVDTVDTAALQLLIGFRNSMLEKTLEVEWANPHEQFRQLADLSGLGRHLGLDAAAIPVAEDDDGLCPVF